MYRNVKGSKQYCKWCGALLDKQADLISRFIYDDCLCIKCRNSFKKKERKIFIDNLEVTSLYRYEGLAREMLIQYKELMDEALYDVFLYQDFKRLNKRYKGYVLVSVPSSKTALKLRGFHHVNKMYELLGLDMVDIVRKKSDFEMKQLNRNQRLKYSNEFELIKMPPAKPLLIVDDVITTGNSLKGIYNLLKNHKYQLKALTMFYVYK